jgi:predicted RNA-binding Zn-ribbon protein involved in translation (DUF1610 family)
MAINIHLIEDKCPACGSNEVIKAHVYAHGDKYECKKCYRMWGGYYNRGEKP